MAVRETCDCTPPDDTVVWGQWQCPHGKTFFQIFGRAWHDRWYATCPTCGHEYYRPEAKVVEDAQ